MWRSCGHLLLAIFVVLGAGTPAASAAGGPTEQLRADIAALYAALAQPGGDGADVLDRMFDWPRMAQRALGEHWSERTPDERQEFTRLFASLFRRAYVSRAHVVDASRFTYLGDARTDHRATVKTSVRTKRGSTIAIDYVVRWHGERWRVEDILVERISLVDNYRTQFDTVVARSSYATLLDKLRAAAN